MVDDIKGKELLSHFFGGRGRRVGHCLAPGLSCTTTAIQAHSVQNGRVLDLLVRDGHVKVLKQRIGSGGPQCSFEDIGRNQATTFAGFCSEHDTSIFKLIDNNEFRSDDPQYLFLLAYRAVSRELHAQMDGAFKIQATYCKRVELGIDSGDQPTKAGLIALQHLTNCYQTYTYKSSFDEALLSSSYELVLHDVITLCHKQPTIAVSSLFSLDGLVKNDDSVRVALNVLPVSVSKSVAMFSYLPNDTDLVRSGISGILTSKGDYQKYLLSKLVLNNCENFVVSPSYYDQWSVEKTNTITDYFIQTLYSGRLDTENENLYLF
jgi:hypothetical protein